MRIPTLDLTPEIVARRSALDDAIRQVLDSGHFVLGQNVREFEKEAARYLGVEYAVSVNSGTDALLISLRALGVKAGDEVITSPFSFFATAEVISLLGAVPVFADIDPLTFNLDPVETQKKITPRTKVIMPVHLFGQSAEMGAFQKIANDHGLKILEDAAQAFGGDYHGLKLGAIGDAAAFSFFPTKNLGAFGDGGMLVTNDPALAETAKLLRVHGSRKRYHHEALGYTSRLDELQAAVLRVKLPWIDEMNGKRQKVAARYDEMLSGIRGLEIPHRAPSRQHIFHQYTVRIKNGRRDEVHRLLAEREIDTMIYYPVPIHRLEVYELAQCKLPHAEQAALEVLSLPLWPDLAIEVQLRIGTELRQILSS